MLLQSEERENLLEESPKSSALKLCWSLGSCCWDWLTCIWWSRNKYNCILFKFIWLKFIPVSQRKHIYFSIKHLSGKPTFGWRFMNSCLLLYGVQSYSGHPRTSPFFLFSSSSQSMSGWKYSIRGWTDILGWPVIKVMASGQGLLKPIFITSLRKETKMKIYNISQIHYSVCHQWFTDPRSFPASLDW